jgi:hypothetical protein
MARNSAKLSPGVLLMRREKVQRHVTPVIALLRIELLNGKQLDDGDTEIFEIGNFSIRPAKMPRLATLTRNSLAQ